MEKNGLVYTEEHCIGCNKCISECPVLTANRALADGDSQRIYVDGSKCIACGACFDACEHEARAFRDDTERLLEDLAKGEKISILWAPAFAANYPDEYKRLLGGLKEAWRKPHYQRQLRRRYYDLGVYQIYYRAQFYRRNFPAVSGDCQLY